MNQDTLRNALVCAGLTPYYNHGINLTIKAQNALSGRTYYVDPGNLRFHYSRITCARPISMGAFYLIVESCAADYENTRRVFRAVCFDVFGKVVYRPDLDASFKSTEEASKAFYKHWNNFNEAAYYAEELKSKTLEAQRAETIFNQALKEEKPSLVDSILQNALNEVTLAE